MLTGIAFEFGWCGFGVHGGLFPELRAGFLRATTYHGRLLEAVQDQERRIKLLEVAVRALRRGERE